MKREIATVKEQYVLLQNIFGYVPSLTMCQDVNKKIDVIQEKLQDALIIVTFVTIKDNIAIFIENIWTKSISENFYKLTTISKKIGFLEILGTKLMQVNTSDQLKICIENVNFYLKTSINQKKIDINVPLDKTIQLPLIETKNKIATILKNLSDLTYNIIDLTKVKKLLVILLN